MLRRSLSCGPDSIFSYILMQGDFLVHFMDIARDELIKRPDEISVEKLQVIFPTNICFFLLIIFII